MTNPYDHTWQQIRPGILARDNYTCQIAGPKCTIHASHVDHIIPINEGGQRLDPTNLRAACATCNIGRTSRRQADLANEALRQRKTPPTTPPTPSRDW